MNNIPQLLNSDDPLSEEALEFVIGHCEEDSFVDYKETFHPEDKEWLEITKDIVAFANTDGGYLVFGVRDRSFEVVGLDDTVIPVLTNTNLILQKVNRHIEPHLGMVRSRRTETNRKTVVVLFIPPSIGVTHTISKDGKYKHPSGEEKIVLHQGTVYVRKSAGNRLATSRDLDEIYYRRFERFRESLLSKIAQVIEAPPESEILVVSAGSPAEEGARKFVLSDGEDAIPVKGMSFTTPPKTNEEAIASSIAIAATLGRTIPDGLTLWHWYDQRKNLVLSSSQKLRLSKFCLLKGVPVFYWLQGARSDEIKDTLQETVSDRLLLTQVGYILNVGSFLGKGFYTTLLAKLKRFESKLRDNDKSYPAAGPRSLLAPHIVQGRKKLFKDPEIAFREHLESELDDVVSGILLAQDDIPDVMKQRTAQALDCYLYAQDDRYTAKPEAAEHSRGSDI